MTGESRPTCCRPTTPWPTGPGASPHQTSHGILRDSSRIASLKRRRCRASHHIATLGGGIDSRSVTCSVAPFKIVTGSFVDAPSPLASRRRCRVPRGSRGLESTSRGTSSPGPRSNWRGAGRPTGAIPRVRSQKGRRGSRTRPLSRAGCGANEHPHMAPFCVKTPWAGWS
jgi:hypothetical protein